MTVRCMNDLEKQNLVKLFNSGRSKSDLAMAFEVSIKTVSRVLIEAGEMPNTWRSEIKLSEHEAALIRQIRLQGVKPREMVHTDHITIGHVHKWFKRLSKPYKKSILQLLVKESKEKSKKVA